MGKVPFRRPLAQVGSQHRHFDSPQLPFSLVVMGVASTLLPENRSHSISHLLDVQIRTCVVVTASRLALNDIRPMARLPIK